MLSYDSDEVSVMDLYRIYKRLPFIGIKVLDLSTFMSKTKYEYTASMMLFLLFMYDRITIWVYISKYYLYTQDLVSRRLSHF